MDPKKTLIIAIIVGAVAVVLLQMRSRGEEGEKVTIFRVTEARRAGETLDGAYESVEVPMSWYAPMQSEVPSGFLETFVGSTPLVRPLKAGDTVTFDALQKSADKGLPEKISPGMRAMAIEVAASQAVGYLVRPGDYVDVVVTLPQERVLVSRFLLQAKKVLAVDQQYRLDDSAFVSSKNFSSVTLEVTPEEAQTIEIARGLVQNGFSLALRAEGDLDVVDTGMTDVTTVLYGDAARQP